MRRLAHTWKRSRRSRGLPGRMPLLAPLHALCLAVARPAARRTARRARPRGYSAPGFWQPGAPDQPLDAYVRTRALTADLFVLAVNEFVEQIIASAVLVLDNASIHTAHLVR